MCRFCQVDLSRSEAFGLVVAGLGACLFSGGLLDQFDRTGAQRSGRTDSEACASQ